MGAGLPAVQFQALMEPSRAELFRKGVAEAAAHEGDDLAGLLARLLSESPALSPLLAKTLLQAVAEPWVAGETE